MWNLVSGADYSSFNRYMVECELICSIYQNIMMMYCFNRYMVECEC